ncbi:WD40 repeat domain-containing protein [Streptomyces sp. NPDC056831]|uniref:WD40 repeat domain-containing protein n=1 Tax=Streptomyces sp. NPDC056831 TaxID=3345954 RepID=UPI003674FDDC
MVCTRRSPCGTGGGLAARQETGPPLATGDDRGVRAVGAISVDGRTILATGHADRTVRIWDLADRASLGRPLQGHTRAVERVATALVDGTPVAVTTAGYDPNPRVWDLTTGRERGEPLHGHRRRIADLAVTTLDDRAVAVTGGDDATVRAWDLHTQTRIRRALRFPYRVHSVTPVDGGALLVGFADELALLPGADLSEAPHQLMRPGDDDDAV